MMTISIHDRLQSEDPACRRMAVIDLPYSEEEYDIAPLLISALADVDASVRLEAAKAIEGYEEPEVLEALTPLLKDVDQEVRKAAALTLAELKQTESAHYLLPYLSDDDPQVKAF